MIFMEKTFVSYMHIIDTTRSIPDINKYLIFYKRQTSKFAFLQYWDGSQAVNTDGQNVACGAEKS